MVLTKFRILGISARDWETPPFKLYFNDIEISKTGVSNNSFLYEYNVLEDVRIKLSIDESIPLGFDPDRTYTFDKFNMSTGNYDSYNFTLSDDNLTLLSDELVNKSSLSGFTDFTIYTYNREVTQVEEYPFIHLYDISERELNELSKTSLYTSNENLNEYIVRLNKIPYQVDSKEKQMIKLGSNTIQVEANKLSHNEQTIDLGTIRIPNRKHKEVGYKNIQVLLYVPYFEPIALEPEYYLGSEIKLSLTINLLSGMGTLNVYNSILDPESETKPSINGDEWVSYTKQKLVGEQIPYELSGGFNKNLGVDRLLTDYDVPYIEVKTLVPDNEVDYRKLEIMEIDDTRDYMKTSKPYVLGNMTREENEEIRSLISKGILINK